MTDRLARVEWPTLALILACYLVWAIGIAMLPQLWLPAAILAVGFATALHSSLTHEAIHGHPFPDQRLNAAVVAPPLGLLVPYGRFRDLHLAHHRDSRLTDPYDDPESNYLDPATWERLPRPLRALLRWNNTLAGRILIGPLVAQAAFLATDARAVAAGDRAARDAWLWHLPLAAGVVALVAVAPMPLWAWAIALWLGHGLLKIRTFLEHQAHEHAAARPVIIEDRGWLALLFLNNNLHVVHHMHPGVPWYRLPALYAGNRARYLARNRHYVYRSYAEVFRRYLLRAKDPVAHPLWRSAPARQGPRARPGRRQQRTATTS